MSKNETLRNIKNGVTKGMVNAYVCTELHTIVTKNRDNGHIPDKIYCPKCDAQAISLYYQVNQSLTPVVEFFKPNEAEIQAAALSMSKENFKTHDHYLKSGGLVSREIEPEGFTKKK